LNRGKRLKPGDTIGVIAPASIVEEEKIKTATGLLESLGYYVRLGASCKSQWYSFAGEDLVRASDINTFFKDPNVDVILCLRGGYGSIRLMDRIDYKLIKENPKVFIGYSDITLLHLAFNQRSNLITFHGPMLASNMAGDYDPQTIQSLLTGVCHGVQPYVIENEAGQDLKSLVDGIAEGQITGGNLITLVSALGTPYAPDLNGKILFIEEVGEPPYRIDRALTQLFQSGKLRQVVGIILGSFTDCTPSDDRDMALMEVLQDRLGNLGVPIVYNFRSGHCKPMMTLPLGARARIDGNNPAINILESVVT
jgi:muramoyltetrapeptide carboxypeptidase